MNRRRFLQNCSLLTLGCSQSVWGANKFKPLFDGKSLEGWHKPTKPITHGTGGIWSVENGVLTGEQDPPGSGNGGILLSDQKFGDFELEIDLNPDWGPDTGVFFRCTEEGHGFQMYVDYHDGGNVGHLRGEMPGAFAMKPFQIFGSLDLNGRPADFTSKPDARAMKWPENVYEHSCTFEQWKKAWNKNDWNTARIRCVGKYPQITTWINDLKICQWNGESCPLPEYDKERVFQILGGAGCIGLQVHRGKAWPKGQKCRWRNIRIKEL
jgi:hypothetical protein